ncbi:hypothetical protein ACSAM1_08225 [Xanthomonas citri pv. bilvae]|uniref:hypothetical protein n=1 Tax=Xanthomonas citri TaxID=346 RepID=UPI0009E6850F
MAQPIQSLGLRRTPELIDGSFCLAILHRRSQTLSLVRDRIGQCRLYYGWTHQGVVFASKLEAIASCHGFSNSLDRNALTLCCDTATFHRTTASIEASSNYRQEPFKFSARWMWNAVRLTTTLTWDRATGMQKAMSAT